MRRFAIACFFLTLIASTVAAPAAADSRIPGESWMRYVDVEQAGFDPEKLKAARKVWEEMPSSAFMVIADGAVVASWGNPNRRFMCHSVRKSFLSALYGIYWDRGTMDLNKTLFDLGIDDTPDPLLDSERQARILDLLKARSGIFHPAAYAGRTDSAPRGSKGAGRYFAYNNWDFNTLATILIEETGDDVFEAFDRSFGQPLAMDDWRVTDGYYHLERDKSRFPAYPFRLSARDAARFGLLFAREGLWGEERILSKQWVRRSSAMYSIDSEQMGYGFMWWILRQPPFEDHGMYAALGVGNQMIAILPESDMVIVNRADTYSGERTPMPQLLELVAQILDAKVGEPSPNPKLEVLEESPEAGVTQVAKERLAEFRGRWDYPPAPLGLPAQTWVRLDVGDGHLVSHSPLSGTFKLYLQPDGSIVEEDSHERYFTVKNSDGNFAGIADTGTLVTGALALMARGEAERGEELMEPVKNDMSLTVQVARAVAESLNGQTTEAEKTLRRLAGEQGAQAVERVLNIGGYRFLGAELAGAARDSFELGTRVFPDSANLWDSLGEVLMTLGEHEQSIRCYQKSLELNPENSKAVAMIARMKAEQQAEGS